MWEDRVSSECIYIWLSAKMIHIHWHVYIIYLPVNSWSTWAMTSISFVPACTPSTTVCMELIVSEHCHLSSI